MSDQIPDKPQAISMGFSGYQKHSDMLDELQEHYGIVNRSRVIQHIIEQTWFVKIGAPRVAAAAKGASPVTDSGDDNA